MVFSRRVIEAQQSLNASANIRSKAKELRKNMTVAEKILWGYLKNGQLNGMHFRRQHPYGIYILDFYCFKANLAIEVDGPIHLSKHEYDSERRKYIKSTGLQLLRFTNGDVEKRTNWVIRKIISSL
jgi:very-short-patch-repair endonuclease